MFVDLSSSELNFVHGFLNKSDWSRFDVYHARHKHIAYRLISNASLRQLRSASTASLEEHGVFYFLKNLALESPSRQKYDLVCKLILALPYFLIESTYDPSRTDTFRDSVLVHPHVLRTIMTRMDASHTSSIRNQLAIPKWHEHIHLLNHPYRFSSNLIPGACLDYPYDLEDYQWLQHHLISEKNIQDDWLGALSLDALDQSEVQKNKASVEAATKRPFFYEFLNLAFNRLYGDDNLRRLRLLASNYLDLDERWILHWKYPLVFPKVDSSSAIINIFSCLQPSDISNIDIINLMSSNKIEFTGLDI